MTAILNDNLQCYLEGKNTKLLVNVLANHNNNNNNNNSNNNAFV